MCVSDKTTSKRLAVTLRVKDADIWMLRLRAKACTQGLSPRFADSSVCGSSIFLALALILLLFSITVQLLTMSDHCDAVGEDRPLGPHTYSEQYWITAAPGQRICIAEELRQQWYEALSYALNQIEWDLRDDNATVPLNEYRGAFRCYPDLESRWQPLEQPYLALTTRQNARLAQQAENSTLQSESQPADTRAGRASYQGHSRASDSDLSDPDMPLSQPLSLASAAPKASATADDFHERHKRPRGKRGGGKGKVTQQPDPQTPQPAQAQRLTGQARGLTAPQQQRRGQAAPAALFQSRAARPARPLESASRPAHTPAPAAAKTGRKQLTLEVLKKASRWENTEPRARPGALAGLKPHVHPRYGDGPLPSTVYNGQNHIHLGLCPFTFDPNPNVVCPNAGHCSYREWAIELVEMQWVDLNWLKRVLRHGFKGRQLPPDDFCSGYIGWPRVRADGWIMTRAPTLKEAVRAGLVSMFGSFSEEQLDAFADDFPVSFANKRETTVQMRSRREATARPRSSPQQ
ncbi:hypothetical protein K491DRAFT_740498 [Lophiostoma macrostomum CBS 122681]|uniref:Uncharacterized protein n=1 Tax=Lophiostoma macrostomum CBS 122681 TaxID=1314788 RepID=A0A6A6SIB4_9PLEO|nr:hypothetical protein K491DRAFT_740498 [Lophiostoma macrostomum CBS 122681]